MEEINLNPKTTTVYLTGSTGFLGSRFKTYLSSRNYKVFDNKIDVSDLRVLKSTFNYLKPNIVINFAGARAYPTIDWCEECEENMKETVKVNVVGATNVMLAALETNAYPIQISSGCVYTGSFEYEFTEKDEPNFYGSFYSRMRIALQKTLAELPILYTRIRMPISYEPHPRNFIDKITSYKRIISIPNSVTLIEDLWPALENLMELRPTGILNLTNDGYITHKQLLDIYRRVVNPSHKYELITLEQLEKDVIKTKRSNCILSTEKAKSLGINMPRLDDKRIEEILLNRVGNP